MARPTGRRRAERTDTADRELAVLVDGPWAPRWYWRDELEAMQATSRRMGYPDQHPAAVLRGYRPTGERVAHPHNPDRDGRAWRHHPPGPCTATGTGTGTAEPAVVARVAQAHRAVAAATAPQIPAPRRALDNETAQREHLHRTYHDRGQHADTDDAARGGLEREGALW